MNNITIIALASSIDNMSISALRHLENAEELILRTEKNNIIEYIKEKEIKYTSFDYLYEKSVDFDELNLEINKILLDKAKIKDIVYAVFDPLFDTSVNMLLKNKNIHVDILPYISQTNEYLTRIKESFNSSSVHSFVATDIKNIKASPQDSIIILEINSKLMASEVKLKLMDIYNDETEIYYFYNDECNKIELYKLDMQKEYNHTSAVFIPRLSIKQRNRYDFNDLIDILKILRAPHGCPWDRKQNHESLRPYLIEEAYETVEAIDNGDNNAICEELGDVLLQVVFHATIAEQRGTFNIYDISSAICKKMIDRHVHVFKENQELKTADEVLKSWEEIKKKEKGLSSTAESMENISKAFGALMRANKVQQKAAKVDFDFESKEQAFEKIYEETEELKEAILSNNNLKIEDELGDLLFSVVNVARLNSIEPELSLVKSTEKFIKRFKNMENLIKIDKKALKHLTLSEMDVYWNIEKQHEK